MKKLFTIASLAFLTSTAFAAEAGKSETGVDYNELSASYVSMDSTSGSTTTTFTGYGLAATYLLTENFFVLGSYSSVEKSTNTIAMTSGSVGYRLPIAANTDAVATIGYSYMDLGTTHEDTYPMSLGVRAAVTPDVDLGADLIYVQADDTQSGFGASIKYKINSNLFVRGDYKSLTDSSQYAIGVGMKF
jgi:lipopolysaccharide assembly outer membrane protein LptD (OstA)